jgi:hypothetical protein
MADPALLPCPFCGNAPVICDGLIDVNDRAIGPFTVECAAVHLNDPDDWTCGTTRHGTNRAEAIRRWNTRAVESREVVALKTLLARNLVFDKYSAEDALDALGGWHAMAALVEAHKAKTGGGNG